MTIIYERVWDMFYNFLIVREHVHDTKTNPFQVDFSFNYLINKKS